MQVIYEVSDLQIHNNFIPKDSFMWLSNAWSKKKKYVNK